MESKLKKALEEADRIDKAIIIHFKDGESIKAYSMTKRQWDYQEKRSVVKRYVRRYNSRYWSSFNQSLEQFLEWAEEKGVECFSSPKPHIITIEEMVDVFIDSFDIDDYSPELDDEDDYGRALNTGSGTYEIETEEDDFFIRCEIEVRAHGSYDPGDYWTPPSSEYEIDKIDVYLSEAGWIDEDGEETLMSKEQLEELQEKLRKHVA